MIEHKHSRRQLSLAQVLDRLLEQGVSEKPASFRKLAEIAQLDPSRDFVGASLQNIDMRDEDLRGFDFSDADLTGADFRRANLQGVRFNNANLTGAVGLHGAILAQAQPEVHDLRQALRDLSMLLTREIGDEIAVEVALGPDLWLVKVNISQFKLVMRNLAMNARDAMPNGGQLTLSAANFTTSEGSSDPDFVEVSVKDTGTGIRPEIGSRVFESGFVGMHDGEGKRTGLGLFVVRELVKEMNGRISYNSEVGRGTTFRILIPRYLPDVGGQPEAGRHDSQKNFDLGEVHRIILRGQALPRAWIPLVVELDFSYDELNNLALLEELACLEKLNLRGSAIVDVAPLAKLTALRSLDLSSTPVTSIAGFSRLVDLEYLNLRDTEIRDIGALAPLKFLRVLDLSGTRVRDLLPLTNLVNLQVLDLMDTDVVDVTILSGLTKLKSLDLSHTKVSDISSLAYLTDLESCNLSVTLVSDLFAIAQLRKLSRLIVSATSVRDISSLTQLKSLKSVDLSATNVSDLAPITGLTKLEHLNIAHTAVKDISVLAHIRGLQIKSS